MNRVFLIGKDKKTIGRALVSIEGFDTSCATPKYLRIRVYDFDRETIKEEIIRKGDLVEISGYSWLVASIEAREARKGLSLAERILLELESV